MRKVYYSIFLKVLMLSPVNNDPTPVNMQEPVMVSVLRWVLCSLLLSELPFAVTQLSEIRVLHIRSDRRTVVWGPADYNIGLTIYSSGFLFTLGRMSSHSVKSNIMIQLLSPQDWQHSRSVTYCFGCHSKRKLFIGFSTEFRPGS
jgi:hypothetical protein